MDDMDMPPSLNRTAVYLVNVFEGAVLDWDEGEIPPAWPGDEDDGADLPFMPLRAFTSLPEAVTYAYALWQTTLEVDSGPLTPSTPILHDNGYEIGTIFELSQPRDIDVDINRICFGTRIRIERVWLDVGNTQPIPLPPPAPTDRGYVPQAPPPSTCTDVFAVFSGSAKRSPYERFSAPQIIGVYSDQSNAVEAASQHWQTHKQVGPYPPRQLDPTEMRENWVVAVEGGDDGAESVWVERTRVELSYEASDDYKRYVATSEVPEL